MRYDEERSENEYILETSKSLSPHFNVGKADGVNRFCITPFELSLLAGLCSHLRVTISIDLDREALVIRWQQRYPA